VINLIPKQLFLCLFFLFFCLRGFSAVFVVTSNADSGPGTLRDALTQAAANGTTEKDYINFNLPDVSEAGRTITLVTQLPDVSSNLVIDGTTQAGTVFGQSNALIEISTPKNYDAITIFTGQNVNNVEFYGLYIFDYYDITISYPDLKKRIGIQIINGTNIIVGSLNKGNLIRGFNAYSLDFEETNNITIKSNIIGLGKSNTIGNDGIVGYTAAYTGVIYLTKCNNIVLGGDTGEGNIIFTLVTIMFDQNTSDKISIKSNNFCVYQDGISTEWYFEFYDGMINISTTFSSEIVNYQEELAASATVDMDISNNLSGSEIGLFMLQLLKGTINVTNNYFNVARDGITDIRYLTQLPALQEPIDIRSSLAQLNIGSNDASKKNYFSNCNNGVASSGDPNVFLRYNDYRCTNVAYYNDSTYFPNDRFPNIVIKGISVNGNHTFANGTTSANAIVDIYSSESCNTQCGIRSYMQTVTADQSGNWQADIQNLNGIFYVAATVGNQTSLYKTFEVNSDNINIQNMRCSNVATITGLVVPKGVSYYWTDSNGNTVSNDLNLTTNKAGKYQLVLNGGCIKSQWFEIDDDRIQIDDNSLVKTDISCGTNNGSIKNLFVFDPLLKITTQIWKDASGTVVGSTLDVSKLSAGSYTLTVSTSDGCTQTYGPVVLKNTTGPNIDQSNQIIQPTNCGQSTGSITNITVTGTGTLKYVWLNAQQQQVGSSADLTNQPAGTYKLQVTDDTQCGPVYSADVIIPEINGITMDESKVLVTNALCGGTGSITGIQVTGASSYKWTDANNHTLITTTPDVGALAPGTYTLTATNSYGCSKSSAVYIISQPVSFPYPVYAATYTKACNLLANGGVSVATDGSVKSARWVDAQGTTVGAGSTLSNVVAGTYQLYLTDNNGCEKLYNSYIIDEYPEFTVANYAIITADECGLNNGSVGATTLAGGIPPYTYRWSDVNNKSLGASNILTNLAAGTYILHVTDNGCGSVDITYTVTEQAFTPSAPSVSNVQLCSSGNSLLSVNNPSTNTTYRLYATESSTEPLDEQKGGRFTINIPGNTSYYISEIDGTCESSRAEIDVTVGVSSTDVANAFTPNGDGINDYWQIKNINNYTNATIQVFNRYGQLLFESKGYAKPFDGTYKGQKLPAGVYYYIINLNAKCNLLSGSLTLIR